MFNISNIIFHAIIAIIIAVSCGKIHELLHVVRAKQLGYKINKIEWWKNEVDIAITQDDPNNKAIGRFPYYVMIPASIIMIVVGWQPWNSIFPWFLGITIAGIGLLLMHLVTLPFEGREDEIKKVSKEGL